jgi:hypothetical protein
MAAMRGNASAGASRSAAAIASCSSQFLEHGRVQLGGVAHVDAAGDWAGSSYGIRRNAVLCALAALTASSTSA